MIQKSFSNLNEEFNECLFFNIIKKNLPWLFLFFFIGLLSAFLIIRYSQEVHQSNSIIQLSDNNQAKRVLNVEDIYKQKGLVAQIELLKSNVFIKRVLNQLPLEHSYFIEGTFKNNELYNKSPFNVETKIKTEGIYGINVFVCFISEREVKVSYRFGGKEFTESGILPEWIQFPHFDL